jgi:ABC-type spermidine/putrescine transport system permease subunit II
MNQHFPMKNLVRALLLLPFIVPTVLNTIAWLWMLDPAFSVVNRLLVALGWPKPMRMIFLPLCTPRFISAGIFAFTFSQNEFLYALTFLTKSTVRTVPVGIISELIRGDVFYWGQLMAGALLGSIPVPLIYSFFVEHYVAGLATGAVKA